MKGVFKRMPGNDAILDAAVHAGAGTLPDLANGPSGQTDERNFGDLRC